MSERERASKARPKVSWHRGGAELAPFATLAAFSSAAENGAELIEVDVRESGDGRLVCVHDPEVPGLGRVDEISLTGRGDDRVLSFERFLDALDEKDAGRTSEVHLDLKARGYEAAAVRAVLERGRKVMVTTGEPASVRAVRSAHPAVDALLTLGRDARGLPFGEQARVRLGEIFPFSRITGCGATGVAAHHALATPVLRAWCKARGMRLVVWTVDDDRSLERWLGRGDVDVVTTNRPMAALAIRGQMT